jgi:predicted HTH transcriptional regulator
MVATQKGWHEEFARFFEVPTRDALRELLRVQAQEWDYCDFKQEWPTSGKLARHLLGVANSQGGCLVAGVAEKGDGTLDPIGLPALIDKAVLSADLQRFLPDQLQYEVINFTYEEAEYPKIRGKKFQVIIVEDTPEYTPFVSTSADNDIRLATIYVRRGTSSVEPTYEELQRVINRRISTSYSSKPEMDLNVHLTELEALYRRLPRYRDRLARLTEQLIGYVEPNPSYPKEDFDSFLARLIEEKKAIVLRLLNRT